MEDGERLLRLGSGLVRIIFHEDCKFYRKDDETKENPLKVLPISNGFMVIRLHQYCSEWSGLTKQGELNYELGRILETLVGPKDIEDKQFVVRIGISQSDTYPVDFYRIVN